MCMSVKNSKLKKINEVIIQLCLKANNMRPANKYKLKPFAMQSKYNYKNNVTIKFQ